MAVLEYVWLDMDEAEKILMQRGISLMGFSAIKRTYKGKSGLITVAMGKTEMMMVKHCIACPSDLSEGAPIYT